MKKLDRRIQKTKEAIHNAFLQLIQSKEYQAITITEIALLANIDRKTFYLHYASIDDVLNEFGIEAADKVRILLKEVQPFNIETFFQGLTKIMEENICFYQHISTEKSYAFFLEQCKNILKNSIKERFYIKSGFTEENFDVYAEYISSGTIGIYTNWLNTDNKMNLNELTKLAIDAVENGWNKIVCNN